MEKFNEKYNEDLKKFGNNYHALNKYVMTHTYHLCTVNPAFQAMINVMKEKQFILFEHNRIDALQDGPTTNIVISNKRSFEAAKAYKGYKTAVLNFANNHHIGGSPYSAGAQEESLCRTSTLLPCLEKEKDTFYEYHKKLYEEGKIDYMGNDDLIYTPAVVVFKTDESAPQMMKIDDWYDVDVITCAAPQLYETPSDIEKYESTILKRLRRIFQVAKHQGVEVLVLGAWGCGAFNNPPELIAKAFKTLCNEYKFDTIEFAIYGNRGNDTNYQIFKQIFDE